MKTPVLITAVAAACLTLTLTSLSVSAAPSGQGAEKSNRPDEAPGQIKNNAQGPEKGKGHEKDNSGQKGHDSYQGFGYGHAPKASGS